MAILTNNVKIVEFMMILSELPVIHRKSKVIVKLSGKEIPSLCSDFSRKLMVRNWEEFPRWLGWLSDQRRVWHLRGCSRNVTKPVNYLRQGVRNASKSPVESEYSGFSDISPLNYDSLVQKKPWVTDGFSLNRLMCNPWTAGIAPSAISLPAHFRTWRLHSFQEIQIILISDQTIGLRSVRVPWTIPKTLLGNG
jgi:hypothetical protein